MKRYSCRQCRLGYVPDLVKTFDPECPGCRKKLADGLRTGHEPHPSTQSLSGKGKVDAATFEREGKRIRAVVAGRKAYGMRITAPRAA